MPKRVVDGDALWLSDKVKKLPKKYRLHYANWLPLAEANGVFEADPDRIHAKIYAFLLPNVKKPIVRAILRAMVEVGLVKIWNEDGKDWGYFCGIEKPGRLPSIKHLDRYSNLPPNPPIEDSNGTPPG
jgi:hypothetical protein